jgi:cyanate permease
MGENSFKTLVPIYESTRRTYATISIANALITTSVTLKFPFQIGYHKIIKKNYSSETSVSSLIYPYVALCLLQNKNTGHDLLKWWAFVSK